MFTFGRSNCLRLIVLVMVSAGAVQAQSEGESRDPEILQKKIDKLLQAVEEVHKQINESQRQMQELSAEIRSVQAELAGSAGQSGDIAELSSAVEELKEQSQVQQAEIKQHEQTKVETTSKYPLRVSGLLLLSSFLNNGTVEFVDLPVLAVPHEPYSADGNLTATFSQTTLGLDATGPHLWGARSAGDVNIDFFGNLPYNAYSSNIGTVRLRTAHVSIDWPRTSVALALDTPLISPIQPTSLLSQALPALAWSGNLWAWSPQIEAEHRQTWGGGTAKFQFGLIDPAAPSISANSGERLPSAGENSRQPGYEARLSYSFGSEGHAMTFGGGGYYGRQKYSYGQSVDAWAATADWKLPLNNYLEVSGELYRGRAIAGLGGGVFKDYIVDSDGQVHGLNAEGGWTQLKIKVRHDVEANAAIGMDNGFSDDLEYAAPPVLQGPYASLARNRTVLANVIFRPRASLAFSAEYRGLHSWPTAGPANTAQSIGLGAGYIF